MDDADILKHYKKYGNTNLITESGLGCNRQIYAIGDSHSIFFHNSMKIYEHWGFGGKIPLTMFTLLANGIDLINVGNILGNGHESGNVKAGDFVLFYYGYNDTQKNIKQYNSEEPEKFIQKMVCDYVTYIHTISRRVNVNPIVVCVYPLPIKTTSLYIKGSAEERTLYTQLMNKYLKIETDKQNVQYLDIYNIISHNGYINELYSDDLIHLDYTNLSLRNLIEGEIYKLIYELYPIT
jgi:hypothetical protein